MPVSAVTLQTWDRVKADIGTSVATDIFDMCFRAVTFRKVDGDTITLGAPNDFAAIWINDNYLDLITQKFRHSTGRQLKVLIESDGRTETACRGKASRGCRFRQAEGRPSAPAEGRGAQRDPVAPQSAKHVRKFRRRLEQPDRPRRLARRRASAVPRLQSALPLRRHRPRQDAPDARHRPSRSSGTNPRRASPTSRRKSSRTSSSRRSRRTGSPNSASVTATSTCSCSTTCSSSPARNASRKSSSTPSTTSSNRGKQIVLTSDRRASEIAAASRHASSRVSSGACRPTSRRPISKPASPFCAPRPPTLKCNLPSRGSQFHRAAHPQQHPPPRRRVAQGRELFRAHQQAARPRRPPSDCLHDVLMEQAQNLLTIETIQKRVADHFQIRHSDMTSTRRPNNIAIPRQIAMYPRPHAHETFAPGNRRRLRRPRSRHRHPRLQGRRQHDGAGRLRAAQRRLSQDAARAVRGAGAPLAGVPLVD